LQIASSISEARRQIEVVSAKLARNASEIVSRSDSHKRLLLQHVRLRAECHEHWACLPARLLTRIVSRLDNAGIGACASVCQLWRHNLRQSDLYRDIVVRENRPREPKTDSSAAEHRVAIRVYLNDSTGSSTLAFDQSLAQLRGESERVAIEHEAIISRLRQAEFRLSQLQGGTKAARRQYGALNVSRGEHQNSLRELAARKKALVSEMAEMDKKLAQRRLAKMESRLQLQDELQSAVAESRRLDAADHELSRLEEIKRQLQAKLNDEGNGDELEKY
jgi:hypothetical protein